MILKSVIFAVFVFGLTAVISLLVAGIIQLIYRVIHKREAQKTEVK